MEQNRIIEVKLSAEREREELLEKVYKLMADGVVVCDPHRLDIRGELSCGSGVKIDVNVVFDGDVVLKDGVTIGANCVLRDCKIGRGTEINPFTLIENAVVGEQSFVGPYGRVRPGSRVGDRVQIGNFVEVKNVNIASNCRINHLSFIGDADLAESVTIGAGTVTCNHDGVGINRTTIEEGAYIGSGCELVAPLKVNSNATVGSGSTITDEVAGDALTIARSRQVTIEDWQRPKSRKGSSK
jgi:bifunctional UDP-N-acetylglucosamine pyrophosphorylase / glucosamine-1-phosphate N-acetyltransferase